MKIEIYLQARMGSTRLPGKSLLPIMGRAMLYYQLSQLKWVGEGVNTVVLTTSSIHDTPIIALCDSLQVAWERGSEKDLLARYYFAAKKRKADVIVRVTGDCPLIDPKIVSEMICCYQASFRDYDLVSNVIRRTYPRGEDIEIFSFQALERAFYEAKSADEREHVTQHFYKNPHLYRLKSFEGATDLAGYRWTVDTMEDFRLIKLLIEHLYREESPFHMEEVLSLLVDHPEWRAFNAHIKQKAVF